MNTTTDFLKILQSWQLFSNDYKATAEEVATLVTYAQTAHDASPREWKRFANLLVRHGGFANVKSARQEAQRIQLEATLGEYPETTHDLVEKWLKWQGITMSFEHQFKNDSGEMDANYVKNQLHIWCHENTMFTKTYDAALTNWMFDEQKRVAARKFEELAHDPQIDPEKSELAKFVRLVLLEDEDPQKGERNFRAAMTTFGNFIHRTKNHLGAFAGLKMPSGRTRWHHHTHLMPVLYGQQENGKTISVKRLLSPIDGMHGGVGFDFMTHDSKAYRLSVLPVMFFDEMAGATKMDIKNLKNIMTEEVRELRRLYGNPSMRNLVSSFMGCSNEDISGLIRDETGNRRFIQFETRKVDYRAMQEIDALKIWKSIDENAESPYKSSEADIAAIKEIQGEQKYLSLVEEWIQDGDNIPSNECKATYLYGHHFNEYAEAFGGAEARFWSLAKFSREMTRLSKMANPAVIARQVDGSNSYTIIRSGVATQHKRKGIGR